MLRVQVSRRDFLHAGSLAAACGFAPRASHASASRAAPAKAVLLLDLFGGPSHIDTFDPKPNAPAEVRGEFGTIPTALPGIRVTEHIPELARRMDRFATIRTVSHRYNSHNPYGVMTGFDGGQAQTDYFARPTNHPSVATVCRYFGLGRGTDLPGYVMLPAAPGYTQGLRRAGPYGGYLGTAFDPVFATADEHKRDNLGDAKDFYSHTNIPGGEPRLPRLGGDLSLDALNTRRTLARQIDDAAAAVDARGHIARRDAAF